MFFYSANVLLLFLTLWLLSDLVRHGVKGMRWIAAGAALAAAAVAAILLLPGWEKISPDLITATQESSGLGNICQLYGLNAHAGPNFYWLTHLRSMPEIDRLRWIVQLNIALTLGNCVLFFFLAKHLLQSLPAVLMLWGIYCGNFISRMTALSELPAALLTTYFWIGVLAVSAARQEPGDGPAGDHGRKFRAAAAAALLAVDTVLVLLTRFEFALFGLIALAVICADLSAGNPVLKRAGLWLSEVCGKFAHWLCGLSWFRLLILFALACSFYPLVITGIIDKLSPQLRWFFSGINPLELSFMNLPFFLFTYLPLGVIIIFLSGTVYASRRWARFFLLPLPLIILYRAYYDASHLAFFEMLRYMTALTPVIMFLAVLGWKQIETFAQERGWGPGRLKACAVILGISLFVPAINGNQELFGRDGSHSKYFSGAVIDMDLQREVRYLLALTRQYRDCVFVSQVSRLDSGENRGKELQYVVFGEGLAAPVVTGKPGAGILDIAREAVASPHCVLFYHGLDCNLAPGAGCASSDSQGELTEEKIFPGRPYNDKKERGGYAPEIRLQLYKLGVCRAESSKGRQRL